jgi:hypothetical protein
MREELDIITAYENVGTYRGAAQVCGTTHKTVKRVVERHAWGEVRPGREPRPANYECVRDLVAEAVRSARGRVSAKRLLPRARAAGYAGSPRNFRRLVAAEKKTFRAERGHPRRPAVWTPGEHLVIDWGVVAGVHVFCAVLAWSRFRFVRFAADEKAATTMGMLAECFEVIGGAPKVVLGPTGWAASRAASSPTGSSRRVSTSGSRRITGSGPTSARRPTRPRRGSWRTWSGMASPTCSGHCCWSTPSGSAATRPPLPQRVLADLAAANRAAGRVV